MNKMNKKGKIIGLSLAVIMVVSLFAVAIPSVAAQNDKPDLVITDIWVVGNRIHYTIENIGVADAPRSLTGLWINGIYRASDMVGPLASGNALPGVFARYNYRGGDIRVCADYDGRIAEEDEENCRRYLPDLDIIDKYETVDVDACTFTVTYTVKNVGDCTAGASTTTTTDGTATDNYDTPALAPGAVDTHTTVTAFACDPVGSVITVTADSAGVVDECDETNNELENEFLCCPDLVITEKEETVDVDACTFTVTYTVKNIGNCKAGASTTTTTDGTATDNYDTPALAPGAVDTHTTVTAFACDPVGSVITVTADSAGVVDECDETNNELENEFLCCPDLVITEKEETVDVDACTFTVTYTVKNIGNCKAGASTTTTTDGTATDNYDTPALAPGAVDTHTTVTAFACDPVGSVITVTADSAGVVDECDETNNELENEFLCCPDLVITEKEETVDVDACTFTVTYTVKNIGNCKAGASTTTTTDGTATDNYDTPALAPGAVDTHTTVTAFACDPVGSVITVTADSAGVVDECDETNNELENEFLCCPDLVITEKEETVDVDACTFTVTYTVKNIGNCKAGASTTTTTDGTATDNYDTPALAPGAVDTHTTVTAFACDPVGSVITVTADSAGVVDECDETNNELENEFLCCPDLVITEKEETVDVDACTFTVTYTVKNIGNCKAGASTTTTTDGTATDNYDTPALAPGAVDTHTTVTAFACDPVGSVITVTADSAGVVDECDETNNELENEFLCCPDLVITEKEETVDVDACTFTVTYTVKNIGNCKAGASTTTTTDGTATDNYDTPALAPGAVDTHTTVTAFACDPVGSVITVTADSAGVVDECDETNNELENEFLCCPDLVITEKEETVDVDACTFTVTYTVKNIGNCKAGASTTTTTDGTATDNYDTPALAPGAVDTHTTVTAFACDPVGSVITVTADSAGVVDECDETNNELENEFLCCPDLVITEKEETVDVDACTFTVTYTVKNIGNCKAGASTTTTTDGTATDNYDTPALAPGAVDTHTTVTAFACDPVGSVITVTADSAGVVDECDETNNEMTNIAICLCEPDLVITGIQVVGNEIHYTIKNIGGKPAPRSLTGLWINGIYRASEMDDPLASGNALPGVFARYNYRGGNIRVCADYPDRIEEADNDNNCCDWP